MNGGLQVYNEQNKLAQWAQTVAQCRESGLSVRQWSQEHNINVSSYYKWKRKVYAKAQEQQESQFAEITPAELICSDNMAVEVHIRHKYIIPVLSPLSGRVRCPYPAGAFAYPHGGQSCGTGYRIKAAY